MRREILIAYYEGNLRVWDTETICMPNDGDLLTTLMVQHPNWEGTTICGVFDYGDPADVDE